MSGWLSPLRWLMLLGLALALTGGYLAWAQHQQQIGEDRITTRYQTAIAKQKAQAAEVLARETTRALDAERRLADLRDQREKDDATNTQTVNSLRARLRAAAGPAGRLRDPFAQPAVARCGDGGGGAQTASAATAASGAADATEAGGLLSKELTGLFQRLTAEADAVNKAYIACRGDAIDVRAVVNGAPATE